VGTQVSQNLVHDCLGRGPAVYRGSPKAEHFTFEHVASQTDLLTAGFTAAGRIGSVVRHEPLLLGHIIDRQEEDSGKQI
jgi:hypothetical protein